MSHLTQRAEQALLGALLAEPQPPSELFAALRSEDFGHRAHQQVFRALVELNTEQWWLEGDDRLMAVEARVTSPGADRSWLEQLRDRAGRPDHLAAYAQMVQVAALRRDVAVHAERIAGSQMLPDLAQALIRQSQAYERLIAENSQTDAPVTSIIGMEEERREVDEWMRSPDGRAVREDWLLADLLQHPEQAPELAIILPDEAFTTPQRREVYQTLLRLGVDGEPIDEVIIAWEIETQRALEEYHHTAERAFEQERSSREPDVVYLTRLASTATTVTAAEIARGLIADDLRAQLADIGTQPKPNGHPAPKPPGPQPNGRSPMPLDPNRHRPQPPQQPGPEHGPRP